MIAVPMKSKSANDVIHAYVEIILPQIGPSRFILTDNGTEFKNDTMSKVLNRLSINLLQYIFLEETPG